MPLLDLFWSMLWFFLFFVWIWLLISIFADIFRSEISGGAKAMWTLFVVIVPFLGVLIYLIANGDEMQNRASRQAADAQAAQREYIQSMAGTGSTADELEKLANLHKQGALNDAEYQAQKQKALSA